MSNIIKRNNVSEYLQSEQLAHLGGRHAGREVAKKGGEFLAKEAAEKGGRQLGKQIVKGAGNPFFIVGDIAEMGVGYN